MGQGTFEVKVGLAEMLKGGVIMDVTNSDQAKFAEDAGKDTIRYSLRWWYSKNV